MGKAVRSRSKVLVLLLLCLPLAWFAPTGNALHVVVAISSSASKSDEKLSSCH